MVDNFCSQAQSRFSAFFHGQSVLTRERYRTPQVGLKAASSRPHVYMAEDSLRRHNPVSRSRTSTRSLIDPVSSPVTSHGTPHTEDIWHYRGACFRPVSTVVDSLRYPLGRNGVSNVPQIQRERHSRSRKPKKKLGCFSAIEDRQFKHKFIGTLISGTLLILLLTICK